jgi:hypothetical protein
MRHALVVDGDILSRLQCAKLLRVSTKTVERWTRRAWRPLPVHQPSGDSGRLFYLKSEVLDWLSSQSNGSRRSVRAASSTR